MNYIQKGSGDYLVLVHGALTDSSMWLPHIQYLASDFDVIAVSLRHFEQPDEGGFGLNTHAADLAKLLSDLPENKPINIVGWSYGADVVLNMLVSEPLPLSSVFLYEPGYPGCLAEKDMEIWQQDANMMFGSVFAHYSAGNLELAVESLIDGSGNHPGYFAAQEPAVKALQLAKAYTLAHQLNQQEQPAIEPSAVTEISTPMVVGYGAETRDIFRLVAKSTAQLAKIADIEVISGENHMLPQEKPELFSALVKRIFKRDEQSV
ncbi:alpha/beta fold hydrolase [Vibrio mangrovi]|uniref:Alpha/beta hydrolase n=1 Tax=Vibrio mangrovi TaxID=474394 RepID=A0ABU4IC61_9VIBR|nr:alpha/beta hydrolase [Vibrio mangrovi]MDW6004207.1 alpha/beta hydrolase [Vibrio mangrovi]